MQFEPNTKLATANLSVAVEDFMVGFDFTEKLKSVTNDVHDAHIWDLSSVQALDMVIELAPISTGHSGIA